MYAHLRLNTMLILQLFLPASDSDLLGPAVGDPLFFDPSLSPNQASFVVSAKLPEIQDSLFENLDSSIDLSLSDIDGLTGSPFSNDDALDKDFQLADCSSLETLFPVRVRRLDGSGNCKYSAAESHSSSEDTFQEPMDLLSGDPDILDKLTETMRNKAANTQCVFYTLSILPWGVCSSGWPPDEIALGETIMIPTRGVYGLFRLEYYKLGK